MIKVPQKILLVSILFYQPQNRTQLIERSQTVVLSESVPDVDKVLLNVEAKEFTMERPTLQSLQQLIQWVADLALNILAKLPESRSFMSNKSQGVSGCYDADGGWRRSFVILGD